MKTVMWCSSTIVVLTQLKGNTENATYRKSRGY